VAQTFTEKIIHWLLLALTIAYLITGLGVTQYRIIEPLTFGLFSKYLSLTMHDNLLIPFVAVLILHVLIKPLRRVYTRFTNTHKIESGS
jgi:dolichol kinase